VSLWDVVEGHDIVAELAQEVCAEGNNCPEGELQYMVRIMPVSFFCLGADEAYVGNKVLLNLCWQGDQAKEEGQVELQSIASVNCTNPCLLSNVQRRPKGRWRWFAWPLSFLQCLCLCIDSKKGKVNVAVVRFGQALLDLLEVRGRKRQSP
jgi:hypothetical protein